MYIKQCKYNKYITGINHNFDTIKYFVKENLGKVFFVNGLFLGGTFM
jgi:hypothetical protein